MKKQRLLSLLLAGICCTQMIACDNAANTPADTGNDTDTGTTAQTSTPIVPFSDLYVDAAAAAGGDGSEAAPFTTITEARDAIRAFKAAYGLTTPITVHVLSGDYRLTEGLTLTEEDSGTADCPITYVSEEPHGAVLNGGLSLSASDFEPLNEEEKARLIDETAAEKVVKVDLTKYGLTADDWGKLYSIGTGNTGSKYDDGTGPAESEFFIDGQRMTLARYPNDSFLKTVNVIEFGASHEIYSDNEFNHRGDMTLVPEYYEERNPKAGSFTVDAETQERMSKWTSYEDLWLFGYFKWQWSDATTPIKNIDVENSIIELGQTVTYGLSEKAPYYFFNVYEEMDMPGEYYIDRENGILYVYPPEGYESAEIMMSCITDDLLVCENVSYLTFQGFSACATRGNGFIMTGHNLTIDNCFIQNVRGGAINVTGTNITVQNCEITKTGTYGIYVTGGDLETLTKSNNLVYNNYIHDWSEVVRTYQSAISLSGCGNTASHNEICNSSHQAIYWSGPYNTIEYNEVYNVCQETSDCGALYAGRNFTSYGCVIRYNYIHDIGSDDVDAHAIYWDDGLSGQTAYGNIIVDITGRGFLVGGGRDNSVYNNVMMRCGKASIMTDNRLHEGEFDDGWYGKMSERPQFDDITGICQSDAWKEAFPELSNLTLDTTDQDNPLLACNPVNNYIAKNVYYFARRVYSAEKDITYNDSKPSGGFYDFDEYMETVSDIRDNYIIKNYDDFSNDQNGDYTMKEDAQVKELIPDFEIIPFDEIGRVE